MIIQININIPNPINISIYFPCVAFDDAYSADSVALDLGLNRIPCFSMSFNIIASLALTFGLSNIPSPVPTAAPNGPAIIPPADAFIGVPMPIISRLDILLAGLSKAFIRSRYDPSVLFNCFISGITSSKNNLACLATAFLASAVGGVSKFFS